jgi:hypothetical protein
VHSHELGCSVSGVGDDYIDLANTYLFVEAQIVDDDDTALDGGADVGPVNLWMHSLFSDVSVSLNGKLVSPPTSLYPYRALEPNCTFLTNKARPLILIL